MPLLYALLGALIQGAGSLVGRVLISLGIGYVTFTGLDTSLGWLKTQIAGSFAGLDAQTLAVLSSLRLGSGLSVLLSALSARMVLNGLTGGTIRKMVQK
jgi:hypothetical protein